MTPQPSGLNGANGQTAASTPITIVPPSKPLVAPIYPAMDATAGKLNQCRNDGLPSGHDGMAPGRQPPGPRYLPGRML